ncbi:MAG: nucleotidyltransferase substrate binding protein, partial [Holosporales bacterium]|nr:nucleotidyltransferase substrate binding protein [Holosporales bacterium]
NELIRIGNENDLLKSDLEKWNIFREKRNITSSTYDEDKAKEVIAIVPDFYEEAAYLLKRLKSKKDDTNLIDIRDKHLEYIIKTIKKYLKSPVVIYAYGSRAKGKAKKYSDLDLAVDCGGKNIPDDALNSIKSELEESLLPIRVDIIDLNSVSPAFYNAIKNDLVKIIS